jgi:spore coat polysaccharide biosynthesis protein SpsF
MSKKLKVVAIIQARMGSTRLPGKSLMLLGGKPVIEHVLIRAKQIKGVDEVVLATTTDTADDALANWAKKNNFKCFRGSASDVLDRYYNAAKDFKADVILRITGDCPLLDPEVSGQVLEAFMEGGVDYVTNTKPPTYPDGMDTEAASFASLERAFKDAKLSSEREHVTPYIWKNKELFKIKNVTGDEDLSNLRLTIDEASDAKLIELVIAECKKRGKSNLETILNILRENPEWLKINGQIMRDEGYAKSLREDSIKS